MCVKRDKLKEVAHKDTIRADEEVEMKRQGKCLSCLWNELQLNELF